MDEDNPDYLVHEIFVQNFWKDHPLGRPILGTRDTVKKFGPALLFDYYKQRFQPGNMVVAAAEACSTMSFWNWQRISLDTCRPPAASARRWRPRRRENFDA